jgi:hypothetical protein
MKATISLKTKVRQIPAAILQKTKVEGVEFEA